MSCRRLSDAEDRLDAISSAAAANEAAWLQQSKTLQALETDAAHARARMRELEDFSQQQTSMLQARVQAEGQLEETIRQLQQVFATEVFQQYSRNDCPLQSLRDNEARATAAIRAASESSASLLLETDHRQKLEAAMNIKDRQISSLMVLNERYKDVALDFAFFLTFIQIIRRRPVLPATAVSPPASAFS
jgi:hypothetical protein